MCHDEGKFSTLLQATRNKNFDVREIRDFVKMYERSRIFCMNKIFSNFLVIFSFQIYIEFKLTLEISLDFLPEIPSHTKIDTV